MVLPYANPSLLQKNFSRYKDTIDLVAMAFEKEKVFNEVPIVDYEELLGEYINLLAQAVDVVNILYNVRCHNEYTFKHSLNVAMLAGALGKWLGFKGHNLKDIILAGLLHDIGKVMIPQNILDKPGKLTDEEMTIIHTHPSHGYELLVDRFDTSEDVKLGILQHHEREDGSGYPCGVRGEKIHIYAKIVAIADMYDAMSTARVYRSTLSPFVVVEIMLEQMHEKLNAEICSIFIANIRRFLLGSFVLLSDGDRAQVVALNELIGSRPVVQLQNGKVIDLEKNRKIEAIAIFDKENIG